MIGSNNVKEPSEIEKENNTIYVLANVVYRRNVFWSSLAINDFAGAKITSDAGFLLMREVDQRFDIIRSGCKLLKDTRSVSHKKHSFEQMMRQRVYQIGAGYEDCNDADLLRIDSALRLALDAKAFEKWRPHLRKIVNSGVSDSILTYIKKPTNLNYL